jgi:hypothetical protein
MPELSVRDEPDTETAISEGVYGPPIRRHRSPFVLCVWESDPRPSRVAVFVPTSKVDLAVTRR